LDNAKRPIKESRELNYNHHNQWSIVTMKSPPEEKIRLMSVMFHGRRDVFARRYERKDGRGGYAPVWSNKWEMRQGKR
jgi:hypothetical protein